jgi:hypothetical protein
MAIIRVKRVHLKENIVSFGEKGTKSEEAIWKGSYPGEGGKGSFGYLLKGRDEITPLQSSSACQKRVHF